MNARSLLMLVFSLLGSGAAVNAGTTATPSMPMSRGWYVQDAECGAIATYTEFTGKAFGCPIRSATKIGEGRYRVIKSCEDEAGSKPHVFEFDHTTPTSFHEVNKSYPAQYSWKLCPKGVPKKVRDSWTD